MSPPLEFLMPPGIGAELIYSFVIIVCSLMVYFGTKELYELSYHKGIKYFRQAFLFFAIAYFVRSIIRYLMFFFGFREIFDFSPKILGPLTLFLFIYFSSMAVFYLLYSVMWKKWNNNSRKVPMFHFLSLIIALLSIASRTMEFRLILNLLIFIPMAIAVYFVYKDGKIQKKRNSLYATYLLLFVFLLLNIIDILIPRFLEMFRLLIYIASTGVFLLIVYKVLKKTGN